jgi:hypothetical protein
MKHWTDDVTVWTIQLLFIKDKTAAAYRYIDTVMFFIDYYYYYKIILFDSGYYVNIL